MPGAELTAVGSRSAARARAFAQEYGAAAAYGSYEELLADDRVDAVYIASPHALHLEHAPRRSRPASTCSARSR